MVKKLVSLIAGLLVVGTIVAAQVTPTPQRAVGTFTTVSITSLTGCVGWADVWLQRVSAGGLGISAASCGGANNGYLTLGGETVTGVTSVMTAVTAPITGTIYPVVQVNSSFTDPTALTQQIGFYASLVVNPSASWSGKIGSGILSEVSTPSANAQTIGTLRGGNFRALHSGSGALTNLSGMVTTAVAQAASGAVSNIFGYDLTASNTGSATTNGAVTGITVLSRNNGGGTITNLIGINANVTQATSSTASGDVRFFSTSAFTNTASTVTGATVGLDIANLTAGAQTGGVFSIRSTDTAAILSHAGPIDGKSVYRLNGVLTDSATAPTVSSGFGTSPTIPNSNGTTAFTVNVGTGGTASAGVLTLPTATTGWVCHVENRTGVAANRAAQRTVQTATTTTTVTVQNQNITTGAGLPWSASDILTLSCRAY